MVDLASSQTAWLLEPRGSQPSGGLRVDDVASIDELPSPREAYEPPRLVDLGALGEATAGSVVVTTIDV